MWCFSLILLLVTAGAASAQGWEENFDGPALDPRWTWRVPVEGPTYSLTERPGWLRVRIPQKENGFNHWNEPGQIDEAPQLRTRVPEGDWELEARVQLQEFDPGSNFHAGLMVGTSDAELLAWGIFYGPGLPGGQQAPEAWLEVTGKSGYMKVGGEARDLVLRLTKVGRTYLAGLRRGEGDWVDGGTYTLLRPPQFLGIIGKTFLNGPGITFDVDYIRLIPRAERELPPLEATVRVDGRAERPALSPFRASYTLECLGRSAGGGPWAEMLANRKFAGPAGETGVVDGWTPVGAGAGVTFAPDNRIFYAPVQSQRITRAQAGEACGIAQSGLVLREGIGLMGRLVAREEGEIGPVSITLLAGEEVLAERQIRLPDARWHTEEFTFPKPGRDVAGATLRITFEGAGTLWIGAVSLMPADSEGGWRKDVIEAARALHPAMICWPGSRLAAGYHWEDGIGPRDQRPARWNRAGGAWETNDVGTHEFLEFCRRVGAEPCLVVNAGESAAREAARWVEYCNGLAESAQGRIRAANGRTEPFGVRTWTLAGNGTGPGGLSLAHGFHDAVRAIEFAQAMRGVDSNIRVAGLSVESRGRDAWSRSQLAAAAPELDYLSVRYSRPLEPADDPLMAYSAAVAGAAQLEAQLQRLAATASASAPAERPVRLALDEWSLTVEKPGAAPEQSFAAGLFACGVLNALTRLGDRVDRAHLGLWTPSGGALQVTPARVDATPVYLALKLHAGRSGVSGVPVAVEGGRVTLPGVGEAPAIDAAASLSKDGRELYLSLVNRHPFQAATVKIEPQGLRLREGGEWAALVSEEIDSQNAPDKPDAVRIETRPLKPGEHREITLPAHSAAVLTYRVR